MEQYMILAGGIIIFYFGVIMGYLLKMVLVRKSKYGGTIYVTHNEEKTLYSLELDDYPEGIAFKKEIVFKVKASEESKS
jgi:hypothetical protein